MKHRFPTLAAQEPRLNFENPFAALRPGRLGEGQARQCHDQPGHDIDDHSCCKSYMEYIGTTGVFHYGIPPFLPKNPEVIGTL